MAIAQQLAGYSLGKADLLRRAMGKKKKEIIDAEFVPFRDGMRANGYSDDAIGKLWDVLVPFSDYAFNKAHTAGYGLVSYWTAYLKANHPAEYMAALLTSVEGRQGQVGDLPQRVPPDGHQGAAAGRQRVRVRLRPARQRHPVRPVRDPQRRHQRRGLAAGARAASAAGSPTSRTSSTRSTWWSATSGPWSR